MVDVKIEQITHNKWLNLFKANYQIRGTPVEWFYASRKKDQTVVEKSKIDGVIIIPIIIDRHGHKRFILIDEWRSPLLDREITFPSGLIDSGEDIMKAARRELKEETGFNLKRVFRISPPVFSSSGTTDESVSFVFAEVEGEISDLYQEKTEDIRVFILDEENIGELLFNDTLKINAKAWAILWGFYISE